MDNLSDDIIKYKKGELTSKQMHALEKKALADPFLAEALEGAGNIPPEELVADISAINEKIANKKKSILFTPLRIAAGIVLLIGSVFLVYQFIPKAETIALKTEKPKPENKNADEKQNAGSGAVIKNEKESEKLKAKSEEAEIKTSKPLISSNQNQAARIKQPESSNQNPTTKIQEPLQAPVQDLASAEEAQTKIEITHDQKPKEIVEPNKAAGAKSMALDKKKEAIVKSDVARSAMPTAKMQIPKSISGHVVSSEDGSPLPGVNVILKGTSNGSVTDARGNYTISVDANNESLVFSFVGFQQQEVEASGRDKVDVQMKDDAAQLSEVVVTGVGIVKDENYEPVIQWAEPIGGRKAYDKYLESNLQYPEEALKNKIKGKAGIEFTVGTDGALRDFQVIKKLGYGCEEEIIRLVKDGPKWIPTTEDNKPIESIVRVRLRFDPAKVGR